MKKPVLIAAAIALVCAAPASAIPVFDASNYVQNILTAARTLTMINNQVQQLQNEAQSLINQARNLTSLPSNVIGELQARLRESERLISEAKGVAFDVGQADAAFRRTYPDAYAGLSRDQMAAGARERLSNSLEALRTATQVQAQVATGIAGDEASLADLVAKSQSAVGGLQAAQATNQLLALQASQTMQLQRLELANGRAAALEAARGLAADAEGQENRRRFMGGSGASYTPASVSFYRN